MRRDQSVPFLLFLTTFLAGLTGLVEPAGACRYVPPPPDCGKTIYVIPSVPAVLPVPTGGGSARIETLVFFKMIEAPEGTGICPEPPFLVDLDLTLDCPGDADGQGSLDAVPIELGPNLFDVFIDLAPGPSRKCQLRADVELTLTDGMILTNTNETPACLGEEFGPSRSPLPPRLDARIVDQHGRTTGNFAFHAAGGSTRVRVELTNNDPKERFTGGLSVTTGNVSGGLPGMSGPQGPLTGVYSLTAAEGDHFRLAAREDQIAFQCPAPGDNLDPLEPTFARKIDLEPGVTTFVDFVVAAHGGCLDGSCSQSIVDISGQFDTDPAVACASTNTVGLSTVPPSESPCPGGGVGLAVQPDLFTFVPSYEVPSAGAFEISYDLDEVRAGVNTVEQTVSPDRQGRADSQIATKLWSVELDGPVTPNSGIDTTFNDHMGAPGFKGLELGEPIRAGWGEQTANGAVTRHARHSRLLDDGEPIVDAVFKTTVQAIGDTSAGTVLPVDAIGDANVLFPVPANFFHLSFFSGVPAIDPDIDGFRFSVLTNGYVEELDRIGSNGFEDLQQATLHTSCSEPIEPGSIICLD